MAADEGLIQGNAHETLRYRHSLGADEKVKIFADVLVKHAAPVGSADIVHVARETAYRGMADALIVTGPATGTPAAAEDVAAVKGAVPDIPVLVGSGVDEDNAEVYLALSDGAIVGTSLKVEGAHSQPGRHGKGEAGGAAVQTSTLSIRGNSGAPGRVRATH